jgi:acetyl-CoA decarbonylase/synthase, CODH/ACS complex subunit gamma
MGLTGLQIFKLLPNTNCKECGSPTCLAFAMKLAAGKEALDKCPYASEEAKAALGAASAPPVRAVTIGRGDRAVTIGEETVFFRHEKTFVRHPRFFRVLDEARVPVAEIESRVAEWAGLRTDRAGEVFQVDGVAIVDGAGSPGFAAAAAKAAAKHHLPAAILASTPDGAAAAAEPLKEQHPLLVPPVGGDPLPYASLAARLGLPLVVSGQDLGGLAAAAVATAHAGVAEILLEPPGSDLPALHRHLSLIRRGALDRVHPGLAYPTFVRVGPGEFARAVIGTTTFGSVLAIDDTAGDTWMPLWTLRQNIYTDPQKPLQMDPGIYPIGEPGTSSPLLVTTNFSLTYFTVSTELEATGVPCHLAIVDAEGMSVLTAWSAGKFSGDRVGKALKEIGALARVTHKTVIIPGYVAVISGELEDALGDGWQVLTGPQEASDIAPFFRDVWATAHSR